MTKDTASRWGAPFYEVPSAERASTRMLLISYCFPPDSTVGALRWQKMTRIAAERGWIFDVITRAPAGAEMEDTSRLADLPPGTRVFGVSTHEPRIRKLERAALRAVQFARARLRRGNASAAVQHTGATDSRAVGPMSPMSSAPAAPQRPRSFPREQVPRSIRGLRDVLRVYFVWVEHSRIAAWARGAARLGLELGRTTPYAAVVSSGPPHMAHEAARDVSKRAGIPFIMDLRDPWALTEHVIEAFASPLYLHLTSKYEGRAVAQASVIAANTDVLAQTMRDHYRHAANRIITVRNGSDDDAVPRSVHGDRFVIAYPGIFYGHENIGTVFRGLALAVAATGATAAQLGIEIIGPMSEADHSDITAVARAAGVAEYVRLGPARPRREALQFMAEATMLLALPGYNLMAAIPSKVYEYARFDAWVLALAALDSALEEVLRGTRADVVAPNDAEGVARVIERRYREFRAGIRPVALGGDGGFSRRAQATILFDAVAACLAPDRQPEDATAFSGAATAGPTGVR